MSIDPKALEAARRIEKGFAAGMNYQEPMSMCDDALIVARALLAGEGPVPSLDARLAQWEDAEDGRHAARTEANASPAVRDALLRLADVADLAAIRWNDPALKSAAEQAYAALQPSVAEPDDD